MIKIRPAVASDKSLILSTFLKSLYYSNDFYGQIDQKAYFDGYGRVIEHLLQKSVLRPLVACLADEPEVVLGWALVEPEASVIHYCYVKKAWRNQGIAKQLVQGLELKICTHLTKAGNAIRLKKSITFNPFKI